MDMEAVYKQALSLLEQNKTSIARPVFEQVLKNDPKHSNAKFGLAVCQFRDGNFPDTEVRLREVLSLTPGHYKAAYYLGLALEQQKRIPEAIKVWQDALFIKPDFIEANRKIKQYVSQVESLPPSSPQPAAQPSRETLAEQLDKPKTADIVTKEAQETASGDILFSGNRRLSSFPGYWLLIIIFPLVAILLLGPLNELYRALGWGINEAPAAVAIEIDGITGRPATIPGNQSPRQSNGIGLAFLSAFIGMGTLLAILLLRWKTTRYKIFERRIELQKGILFRKHSTIWLYEIKNSWYSQGPLLRLTNNAKVSIETETTNKKMHLVGLGNPQYMRGLWDQIRDSVLFERREMKKWWI